MSRGRFNVGVLAVADEGRRRPIGPPRATAPLCRVSPPSGALPRRFDRRRDATTVASTGSRGAPVSPLLRARPPRRRRAMRSVRFLGSPFPVFRPRVFSRFSVVSVFRSLGVSAIRVPTPAAGRSPVSIRAPPDRGERDSEPGPKSEFDADVRRARRRFAFPDSARGNSHPPGQK